MLKKQILTAGLIALLLLVSPAFAQDDACTTITVGKKASTDGSVMTSHTCDSRTTRTWIDIVPGKKHGKNAVRKIYGNTARTVSADNLTARKLRGEIPQQAQTYKYFNSALPFLNEKQVGIGESTFGGKKEMQSDNGLIDYRELNRLMAERAVSARDAIRIVDELTKKHGYISGGECFTIADTKEVWHLEIVGPGKGKKGAVWVAKRVPDDHISVNANASRIREVVLNDKENFMYSENVFSAAEEAGLWSKESGKTFEFCYVYGSRRSMGSRRREWRVFDLVAPSLKLDPNGENFPFSVKPEKKVGPEDIMRIFRDTFEDTPFDMTKYLLVQEKDEKGKITGKFVKSPYANPFMHYDMMPLFKINGGWNELGERCIARYYCTYVTVVQLRDWLPNAIGGLTWFGLDNTATTSYAPLYAGMTSVPQSYRVCGRPGFNRNSAWWAFNRVADLAAQKWGYMRKDCKKVWSAFEKETFEKQAEVEKKALVLYKKSKKKASKYLNKYSNDWMNKMVKAYWKLGDDLWSKYTGKF